MIICFSGTPGSGKTYEAVVKIIDNLRLGRVVYTNIDGFDDPACLEMIKTVTGFGDYELSTHLFYLAEHQVKEFWKHCKPKSLIIIDEVHKFFSSRNWQKAENQAFSNWASTHRHYGYDVVLLTQDIEKIDSHVRSLVEWTYYFRKVNFLGSSVKRKYICYSYIGSEHKGRALGKNVRTYNPKIFLCYKSFVTKDIKELGIMTHFNVLKHPVFFILPFVLCLVLYLVFFKSSIGTGDLFGIKRAENLKMESLANLRSQSSSKIVRYDDVMAKKESSEKTTSRKENVMSKKESSKNITSQKKDSKNRPIVVVDSPSVVVQEHNTNMPAVVGNNNIVGVINGKYVYSKKDNVSVAASVPSLSVRPSL